MAIAVTSVHPLPRCYTFPDLSESIPRENVLDSIDAAFSSFKNTVVVVEGQKGVGKTILLAQFVERHQECAFSLFTKPMSRFVYDPELMKLELYKQVVYALGENLDETVTAVDYSALSTAFTKLERKAQHTRSVFYFVVDGLDSIPDEDEQHRELILSYLPFGMSSFRFLLSWGIDKPLPVALKRLIYKTISIHTFSESEVGDYLRAYNLNVETLKAIRRVTGGFPEVLASFKRLLNDMKPGASLDDLLSVGEARDLFEVEWERAVTQETERILAYLAHSRRVLTIKDLADLLQTGETDLEAILEKIRFISIDNRLVTYVSDSFRRFAASKLQGLRESVLSSEIDYLSKRPRDEASLTLLPIYFVEAKRFDELLDFMQPENFTEMVSQGLSSQQVQRYGLAAVNAAHQLERDSDLFRLGIACSTVADVDEVEVLRSELRARVACEDYEAALSIARGITFKEHRLRILAYVVKLMAEKGVEPDSAISEPIYQLVKEVDLSALGADAVEIACDLLHFDSELAMQIVEKATDSGESDSALDWAFAKLALVAATEELDGSKLADKALDPTIVLRFSAEAEILMGRYSATAIMKKVASFDSVTDQVYLLRHWTLRNRKRDDAHLVTEHALNLIMKETNYSPNAKVLSGLAAPLPFIKAKERSLHLLQILDAQRNPIEALGPTIDYVRLQLLLAETEMRIDRRLAADRYVEIYAYVSDVADPPLKAECLAVMYSSLKSNDNDGYLEASEGLLTIVKDDLDSILTTIISETADQYNLTARTIRVLAKVDPQLTTCLAAKLNTLDRRDHALNDIAREHLKDPERLDLQFLDRILKQIRSTTIGDLLLVDLLWALRSTKQDDRVLPFIRKLDEVKNAAARCRGYCAALHICKKSHLAPSLMNEIAGKMRAALERLDTGVSRASVGFRIASELAEDFRALAYEFLKLAEESRQLHSVADATWALGASIFLVLRAFAGLVKRNLWTDEDLQKIETVIDQVPAAGLRAKLWARLVTSCWLKQGPESLYRRIVSEHVRPLINSLPVENAEYRNQIIADTAPALYLAHRKTAMEVIADIDWEAREIAYANIICTLIYKVPHDEPLEVCPGENLALTYEEIVDICELLSHMEEDSAISHYISVVAECVSSKRSRFSKQQKQDMARRIEELISKKLPNPDYIKHEGYKITSMARVLRIKAARREDWLALIAEAQGIPNTSDRALVMSTIAECLPQKELSLARDLVDEVCKLIPQIPSLIDQAGRYVALAEAVKSFDGVEAPRFLREAIIACKGTDTQAGDAVRRRIIDIAYNWDSELAASLASLSDNDPARDRKRKSLTETVQFYDLKKKITDSRNHLDLTEKNMLQYADATWQLLGSLNAGRISTNHQEHMRPYVHFASRVPLRFGYPMFSWAVENAVRRFEDTEQANVIIRPLFNAALVSSTLAGMLAASSTHRPQEIILRLDGASHLNSIIVDVGERDKANRYIRAWFNDCLSDHLYVIDPYFGPDDLEMLKLVLETRPSCQVSIVTSIKHQRGERVQEPWAQAYRSAWRTMSSQDPPDTEVIIAGLETTGDLPVHDRWWVCDSGGLAFGASYNYLGTKKVSDIKEMSVGDASLRLQEIIRYVDRSKREHQGVPIRYELFTL